MTKVYPMRVIKRALDMEKLYKYKSNLELKSTFASSSDPALLLSVLSVASERTVGLKPFECQLFAALRASQGYVLDMKTGEGKTLVAALAACLLYKTHDYVRVATSNEYLSERDFRSMSPLFEFLDIPHSVDSRVLTDGGIGYSDMKNLCLSWIEDYLSLSEVPTTHDFLQRNAIIIDEIDLSLIENSVVPYAVTKRMPIHEQSIREAVEVCMEVEKHNDVFDECSKEFKENFYTVLQKIFSRKYGVSEGSFYKKFTKEIYLVQAAYVSRNRLEFGEHYTIKDGEIFAIDPASGRIVKGGFPSNILATLELKEGLQLSSKEFPYVTSALPNYVKQYNLITGMSGTAMGNSNELSHVYGLSVQKVPLNSPKKLNDRGYLLFESEKAKFAYALDSVKKANSLGRPCLLVCTNEKQAELLFDEFQKANLTASILTSKNLDEEDEIVQKAGYKGSILITTRLCGRGTDIVLGSNSTERSKISDLGGLYVLAMSAGTTMVEDLQVKGRCARQSDKGEVVFLTSIDDEIFAQNVMYQAVLPMCVYETSDELKSSMDIAEDKKKNVYKAIKQSQTHKQALAKEQRSRLMMYNQPVTNQLSVLTKLRLGIKRSSSVDDLITNLGFEHDYDFSSLVASLKESIGEKELLTFLKDTALHYLNSKWEVHNMNLIALREEQLGSPQGGFFKYKESCKSAFEDLVEVLKPELRQSLIVGMSSERDFILSKNSLLSEEEMQQIEIMYKDND
nr:hypothetical protein [Vibrio sp. D431a]